MKPLLLLWIYLQYASSQNCPEKGISSHRVVSGNGKYRLTTITRGRYMINGLLAFTDQQCHNVTEDGLVRVFAMKYAVDKANRNNFQRKNKIGLQLDDVCFKAPLTMSRGMEILSQHRPQSVCRADFLKCDQRQNLTDNVKPVIAVVGTLRSSTSIPLASLMALYNIPQVSNSASSRILSKKELYKSFFRTIPSDTNQIAVMLDIIKVFDWNYVFAIGSNDDYGKLAIAELKQQSHSRNASNFFCVTHDEYITSEIDGNEETTKEEVKQVINKLKVQMKANYQSQIVVVLFCYAESIGKHILLRAQEEGVFEGVVWLTSESWHPHALGIPTRISNRTKADGLRRQLTGVLSVSLKVHNMSYLFKYIEKEIRENFQCDMWFQNYMETKFNCFPEGISPDGLIRGCSVNLSTVVNKLASLPGTKQNLVDAVTAITQSIHNTISNCSANDCSVISPTNVLEQMRNVSFTNEQGKVVSFDQAGDPLHAYYSLENIQMINGQLQYRDVGNWSSDRSITQRLQIDTEKIQWPTWFHPSTHQDFPYSRCSPNCVPGEEQVGRSGTFGCCWKCHKCPGETYTNVTNARKCMECATGFHTYDHVTCQPIPTDWLNMSNAIGLSIVILSSVGLCLTFVATLILVFLNKYIAMGVTSPQMIYLCCTVLHLTFGYGILHILKPTDFLCEILNSSFFVLLMLYSSIVMIQTKFFSGVLNEYITKHLNNQVFLTQMLSLLIFLLIESMALFVWFKTDVRRVHVNEFTGDVGGVYEKYLSCYSECTPGFMVSLCIPFITLTIAAFCSFRERDAEHSFHEPKFLSFASIALVIIVTAFIPTYWYSIGRFRSLIVVITADLLGFIGFMACLVAPKVYVALVRRTRGEDLFPIHSVVMLPRKSQVVPPPKLSTVHLNTETCIGRTNPAHLSNVMEQERGGAGGGSGGGSGEVVVAADVILEASEVVEGDQGKPSESEGPAGSGSTEDVIGQKECCDNAEISDEQVGYVNGGMDGADEEQVQHDF